MIRYDKNSDLLKKAVILADFVLLNLLLDAFFLIRSHILTDYLHADVLPIAVCVNLGMVIAEYFFPSKVYWRRASADAIVRNTTYLTLMQGIMGYMLLRLIRYGNIPFIWVAVFILSLYFTLLLSRLVERIIIKRLRRAKKNTRRVLLVGNDPMIPMLYERLTSDAAMGYDVIGYYADSEIPDCPEGLSYLGGKEDLNRNIMGEEGLKDFNDVFCCLSHDRQEDIENLMMLCDRYTTHFFYVPRMSGNMALRLKMEYLGDIPLFASHEAPLNLIGNRMIKRCFDILFSLPICIILTLMLPFIALIIKLQSRGPLFFRQERTGMNGESFNILKFRSMHVNKDADTLQATKDDPRKFAFGSFMRRTNIDELPQFYNVLKGDMSVVGPRPHMLKHTEQYSKLIDSYMVRHFAKPGITGWAQVNGFRGETQELWQMTGRVKRDIWYIENWTVWLDIRIIYLTIKNMLARKEEMAY